MNNTRTRKDYLNEYLSIAPVALALVRAIECRLLEDEKFAHPMLDVGCGDGLFASTFFEEKIDEGIDISPVQAERAKKTGAYKNVTVADATSLPFKDEYFSTVFSNCVLEHIPEIDRVLREISRVLKEDGKLVFTVPSDRFGENLLVSTLFRKSGLPKMGELYARKLNSVCKHYNLHSPGEWEKKLNDSGLTMKKYTRYLSPSATKAHEIMIPASIFSMMNKRLFGRMILFPKIRKLLLAPILSPILRGLYESDSDKGSSLLIVAAKRGQHG